MYITILLCTSQNYKKCHIFYKQFLKIDAHSAILMDKVQLNLRNKFTKTYHIFYKQFMKIDAHLAILMDKTCTIKSKEQLNRI